MHVMKMEWLISWLSRGWERLTGAHETRRDGLPSRVAGKRKGARDDEESHERGIPQSDKI